MHQCLQIAEIFSVILDHVADRASLARVAVACHAFHEPAVDHLWYTLDDLMPLVLLLPEEYVGESETESLLTILRKPFDDEWNTYDRYASRVRELHLKHLVSEDGNALYVARECYAKLLSFYPAERGHPLPHLISASWNIQDQQTHLEYPDLRVLVRPTLRSLSWTHVQQTSTSLLLEELQSCGATLRDLQILKLSPVRITPRVLEDISRFICSSSHVRTVRVPSLLPLTIKHLGSLRTLEVLSFQLINEDLAKIFQGPQNRTQVFTSLRYLSLKICSKQLAPLLSFIRALPRAGLAHFKVTYLSKYSNALISPSPQNMPPDIRHLEKVISALATFETLRTVSLQLDQSLAQSGNYTSITGASLLPLYSNKHLTKLTLTRIGCRISATTLADFLRAWPDMTHLILGQSLQRHPWSVFDESVCLKAEEILPLCAQHRALQRLHVYVGLPPVSTGGGMLNDVGVAESGLQELVLNFLDKKGKLRVRIVKGRGQDTRTNVTDEDG